MSENTPLVARRASRHLAEALKHIEYALTDVETVREDGAAASLNDSKMRLRYGRLCDGMSRLNAVARELDIA